MNRILYLDCSMGAAGDMLTGALLELLPDREGFLKKLNALGIPDTSFEAEQVRKCGIAGTHMHVKVHGEEEGVHEHTHHHDHTHHHVHRSMADIEHLVRGHLNLPDKVREDVLSVYRLIAEAESRAHGVPVSEIHFHEVGTMDALADISAVCLLMDELNPDLVIASPVHVGSGQVRCPHGILPVPAPATAYILKDVPVYGGAIRGELCTPTGAALLKTFVSRFGSMPVMRTTAIGYGMGMKDFPAANCVRAMLGEEIDGEVHAADPAKACVSTCAAENDAAKTDVCGCETEQYGDRVAELSCNVDDMTAEAIGFATERLLEEGALDVFTIPIGMKKNRPGTMICLLCEQKDAEKMAKLLFLHTTTIGVRRSDLRRYKLERRSETVETPLGHVRKKTVQGYGVCRSKYEYEDIAAIAREKGISFSEVLELVGKSNE